MCLQFHNQKKMKFSKMKISYASPLAIFDPGQKQYLYICDLCRQGKTNLYELMLHKETSCPRVGYPPRKCPLRKAKITGEYIHRLSIAEMDSWAKKEDSAMRKEKRTYNISKQTGAPENSFNVKVGSSHSSANDNGADGVNDINAVFRAMGVRFTEDYFKQEDTDDEDYNDHCRRVIAQSVIQPLH